MNGGNDAVDIAPFVDDTDDDNKTDQQDSEKDDGKTPVEPNTPEAVEAENEVQSIGGDDEEDVDSMKKITEKLDEAEKLIEKLDALTKKVDGDDTDDEDDDNHQSDGSDETDNENERKSTMSYGADRRTAAEEATTQEDRQRELKDQGIAFEGAKEQDLDKTKADEPSSSNFGDNLGGSTIQPGDIDETDKPVVKGDRRASTGSIMKLVDQYIKAGVIKEADRYTKIDSMSHLTASAVANQSSALDAVMRANARRSARLNRIAIANARRRAKRCADGDEGTSTDDKDFQATPSPVDPSGKADNGKTRDDDTKTSALIDRYGIARGSVTAHRGIYRWNLTAASKKASRTHGIAKTMTGAIIAATNASGILGGLSVANDATIRRAAKRRDTKKASVSMKRIAMAKRRSSALASKSHFASRPSTMRLSSAAPDTSDDMALI